MSLQHLAQLFRPSKPAASPSPDPRGDANRVATAALLLEIAYADSSISMAEEGRLVDHLRAKFGVDEEMARELLEAADELRSESIDHFSLTRSLRRECSLEERIEIVKTMWRIVYSDGALHQYENYLVRKLADLLGIEHHVMIEAKLAVQAETRA